MRSLSSPFHASLALAPAIFLLMTGCEPPAPDAAGGAPGPAADKPAADRTAPAADKTAAPKLPVPCAVPAPAGAGALVAHQGGVVFVVESQGVDGPGLRAERWAGEGCDLQADGSAPLAVGALFDADDGGNLYVFPAEAHDPGVASTMPPGEEPFGFGESLVAKVDAAGHSTKLVYAGRGIWSFGASPQGGSFWVTACGPTGIYSMNEGKLAPAIAPPSTLWEQSGGVLTDDHTFWSVGVRTCTWPDPVTPGCGFALVRSTPEGDKEVGTTVLDLGAGFEQAALARCGGRVCGVLPGGVVVWGSEGQVLQIIRPADVAAAPSERIAQVSGNQHGLYLLLRGEAGARVVFLAAP